MCGADALACQPRHKTCQHDFVILSLTVLSICNSIELKSKMVIENKVNVPQYKQLYQGQVPTSKISEHKREQHLTYNIYLFYENIGHF